MTDNGLKYYQADTDRYRDVKVRRLLKKYKGCGYAIYEYALNECFANGYYAKYDADFVFSASDDLYEEEELVKSVIDYCAELGLFDIEMYGKGILTSKSIQRRYEEINTKMRRKVVTGEYWLLEEDEDGATQECTELRNDVTTLRNNVTTLHNDVAELYNDVQNDNKNGDDCTELRNDATKNDIENRNRNNILSDCMPACTREGEDDVLETSRQQIETWRAKLEADESWIDAVSQEFYPTDSKTRKEELRARLADFARDKISDKRGTLYPQVHEFIEHFKRWMRIKQSVEKKETQTKQAYHDRNTNTNVERDKRRGTDATITQSSQYQTAF